MLIDIIKANALSAAQAGDWEAVAKILNAPSVEVRNPKSWTMADLITLLGPEFAAIVGGNLMGQVSQADQSFCHSFHPVSSQQSRQSGDTDKKPVQLAKGCTGLARGLGCVIPSSNPVDRVNGASGVRTGGLWLALCPYFKSGVVGFALCIDVVAHVRFSSGLAGHFVSSESHIVTRDTGNISATDIHCKAIDIHFGEIFGKS